MQSLQTDPILPFSHIQTPTLKHAWTLVRTHARPRRLIREDPGVRGPLWFGSDPSSRYHTLANVLRLICAIIMAPSWMWLAPRNQEWFKNRFLRHFFWPCEAPQLPQTIFAGSGSNNGAGPEWGVKTKRTEYSVDNLTPTWLLEVQFRDDAIVSQRQVRYEDVKRRVGDGGYTAIGYASRSAQHLFIESGSSLDPEPQYSSKHSLKNRRLISQSILDEYAIARTSSKGKTDGLEYIWLDDFCLADECLAVESEANRARELELGQVADIFRLARRVVIFCHLDDCDHTSPDCPWANRLFALAEIMHTQRILRMTRTTDNSGESPNTFATLLTPVAGQDFRAEMMSRAAEAKMWDLYNIMQHSANPGGISWQTMIHSLVLDVLRRDEAENLVSHTLVAKALNGLLPRRAQPACLRGVNGWADLSFLLELNQGFYNSAALAAVCKLPDAEVNEYRWLGKPILPTEGTERLEPLVTANPVSFRDEPSNTPIPVLSLTGPQIVDVDHMLQRDSGALERQPDMQALRFWALVAYYIFGFLGIVLLAVIGGAGVIFLWLGSIFYVVMQLIVGTIYVEKDKWVVVEDWKVPGRDAYGFLQTQDPSYTRRIEWNDAKWDVPHLMEPRTNQAMASPYAATLIDLSTGVFVKTLISTVPNTMAVLATHGSGVTVMLLDREIRINMDAISVKAGMANLPPRALSQTKRVGNIYVGGGSFKREDVRVSFIAWLRSTLSGGTAEGTKTAGGYAATQHRKGMDVEMRNASINHNLGVPLQHTTSVSSTAPMVMMKNNPYRSSMETISTTDTHVKGENDISLARNYPPARYKAYT